jgi:hypothetical protein
MWKPRVSFFATLLLDAEQTFNDPIRSLEIRYSQYSSLETVPEFSNFCPPGRFFIALLIVLETTADLSK